MSNIKTGDDFIKFGLGSVLVNQTTGETTVFNTMQADQHQGIDNQAPGSNQADNMPKPDTSVQPSTSNGEQSAKSNKKQSKNTSKK